MPALINEIFVDVSPILHWTLLTSFGEPDPSSSDSLSTNKVTGRYSNGALGAQAALSISNGDIAANRRHRWLRVGWGDRSIFYLGFLLDIPTESLVPLHVFAFWHWFAQSFRMSKW